jgi:MerR family transcriptional regulator, heat shock protein HspR
MSAKKDEEPLYVISIAAKLADVHPQTLRIYERKGLIVPARVHNRRRYSDADMERCRLIQELTQEMGVNLAGVKMILEMRQRIDSMTQNMQSMQDEILELHRDMEERLSRGFRNDLMPLERGEIVLMKTADPFRKMGFRRKK